MFGELRSFYLYQTIIWSGCALNILAFLRSDVDQSEVQTYVEEQSEIANNLLKNYDKRFIPRTHGKPLEVTLQVVIQDILKIDDMETEMLIYIRQSWYDFRLAFNGTRRLKIREHFLDKIWLPDVRIVNLKEAKRFEGFGGVNMNIYQDGRIYYSQLVLIKTSCPMDLHAFPLDRQTCSLNFSSFAYSNEHLNYTTNGQQVYIKRAKLPQFDLVETSEIAVIGKVPGIVFSLTFQRRFGYYLMTIYIPSICIVILSWLAFFLDSSNITDRLALEITTTLTIVFLLDSINEGIIHVSYAKASDVFVIASFGFIFVALLETVFVFRLGSFEAKKSSMKRDGRCTCRVSVCYKRAPRNAQGSREIAESEKLKVSSKCCCRSLALWIDRISVIMFPCMYLLFNIVYWIYYTRVDKE